MQREGRELCRGKGGGNFLAGDKKDGGKSLVEQKNQTIGGDP